MVWCKTSLRKLTPIRVENSWPALVDKTVFDTVQRMLAERSPKIMSPRRVSSCYILSGLARCGHCGKALGGREAKNGRNTYYVCCSKDKKGPDACPAHYIPSQKLEQAVIDKIQERILTEANLREMVLLVNEEIDSANGGNFERIATVDAELRDIKQRLTRHYEALEAGYRHIDTAAAYGNEKSVGQAIRQSGIDRKKIFVTTKLAQEDMRDSKQMKAFEKSLKLLQMDYIDLYLIHWPVAGKTRESWKVLEEIYKSGRARAIGMSNFIERHLDELLRDAKTAPSVNQIELHPHLSQQTLVAYSETLGIAVEAWSPLGGTGGKLLDDPVLKKIAKKYGKSVAQLVLRWDLQRGIITIPKSIHQAWIIANSDLYKFELSAGDVKAINDLDSNLRRMEWGDPETHSF